MERLARAMGTFLGFGELTDKLARVLASLSESGTISYDDVEQIAGPDSEDVLLLGWEWKLLLPVRTSRCGEWDDRLVMAEPGEMYEMPNVSRLLVEDARQSGEWNSQKAIESFFKTSGEPEWEMIPQLVRRMQEISSDNIITAAQVAQACRRMGLGERVDTMIAILKGAGVMSPRLGSLQEVVRAGVPLYELNPCLFAELSPKVRNGNSVASQNGGVSV
ncbi:MAG: hypothetical protein R6U37_01940 [Dehalococcoidia bacterium]